MENVSTYLKKELIKYIKQEVEKGNSVENVKKALIDAGHHHNIIQEAIDSLKKNKWDLIMAMNEPVQSKLQQDLYYDVINSLVRYIEYNIAQGRTIHEIEKSLSSYGHSQDTINSAIKTVLNRRKDYKTTSSPKINVQNLIIIISIVAFIVLMLLLSSSTRESIGKIFIGLLPTLLTLIFSVAFIHKLKVKSFLTILPFTFVMIFVFAGAFGNFEIFQTMDIKSLAIINLVISLFYVGIIIGTGPDEPVKISTQEKEKQDTSNNLEMNKVHTAWDTDSD